MRMIDGRVSEYTSEGVTLQPFDRMLHESQSQSFQYPERCAHGGQDTCPRAPLFSVTSPAWRISACEVHVFGALAAARTEMRRVAA